MITGVPAKYILPLIHLMWEDIIPKKPIETEDKLFRLVRQYLDYGISKEDFLELAIKVQSKLNFIWDGYLILFSHLQYGQFNSILEERGCSFQQTIGDLLEGKEFSSWADEENFLKVFKKTLDGINHLVCFGNVPKENIEWWIHFLNEMRRNAPYKNNQPINQTIRKMAEGLLNFASEQEVILSNNEYCLLLEGKYPFLERFRYLGVKPKIKFSTFEGSEGIEIFSPHQSNFAEELFPMFGDFEGYQNLFVPNSSEIDVIGEFLIKLVQEWAIEVKLNRENLTPQSFKYMGGYFPFYSFC